MSAVSSPNVSSRSIGITRGHRGQGPTSVSAHTLRSSLLSVEIWEHGARLVEVAVPDRSGTVANIVLRHEHLADYDDPTGDHAYLGATIGRYTNRIANSSFLLDGAAVTLVANEGVNQLHGGPIGFDQYVWTSDDIRSTDDGASVRLHHVSPSGDQGFPGAVTMSTTYTVLGNELRIDTVATTDAPTVIGSTNHAYWNLAGDGTIVDHVLRVEADRYVDVDEWLVPDGSVRSVDDTRFDFRSGRRLADVIAAGGIDHCLVMQPDERVSAELRHEPSGRTMTIHSNQPGMQVYTSGTMPRPFGAVCLESQALPDTPNHARFGSCELRPGQEYRHMTIYTFTNDG